MFASNVGLLKKQLMTEYTQEVGDSPAEGLLRTIEPALRMDERR